MSQKRQRSSQDSGTSAKWRPFWYNVLSLSLPSLHSFSVQPFANIADYQYPDALDAQTIVIFILCVILIVGAITSIIMAIRQRWVYVTPLPLPLTLSLSLPLSFPLLSSCELVYRALHDTRSKLLADVFYGSPGSTSLIENVHHENIQLEQMETRG